MHDRVAGSNRGDAVGDGHRQRVVPRADQPHDALGLRRDRHPGEQRQCTVAALRLQLLLQATGIEARRQRHMGNLVEGVGAALAGLNLDQVEQLVLVLEHEVVQTQQRLLALAQRSLAPCLLCRSRSLKCRVNVLDA